MKTPEGYEKDAICSYLKQQEGVWLFRSYSAGFGVSGVPDIVGCSAGRFFGIEVKREGKTPTRLQEIRMEEITIAGGKVFWGTAEKVIGEFEQWIFT